MKVIGIDPGFNKTGFGIVEQNGSKLTVCEFGVIRPDTDAPLEQKLSCVFKEIQRLCELYKPDMASIEELFFVNNVRSGIKVGEMRGVLVLACALAGIPVYHYTPKQIKQAVTGTGAADKEQVARMVQILTGAEVRKIPLDAYDALAAAVCHLNSWKMVRL